MNARRELLDKLAASCRRLAGEVLGICEVLERGQADAPLTQYFGTLFQELEQAPFPLCVVSLSTEAAVKAAHWLGYELPPPTPGSPSQPGLIELTVRADGRTEINANPLRVLMLQSLDALAEDPAVLGRITQAANTLFVTGSAQSAISADQSGRLGTLAQSMDAVWPVVIVDQGGLPSTGWWSSAELGRAGIRRQPWVLGEPAAPLPALLCESTNVERRTLLYAREVKRFCQAVETVEERFNGLREQLRARKLREERAEKLVSDVSLDPGLRTCNDVLRTALQDELAAINKAVQENNRRAGLRDGSLTRALEEALETLKGTDLAQQAGHKTIQLSVSDTFLSHLNQVLRRACRDQLNADMTMVRDALRVAQDTVEKEISVSLGEPLKLDLPPPDGGEIKDAMAELLRVSVRYRGEIPRRSFIQRLAEGRKMLFGVMMTVSLFGTLLLQRQNVRSLLAPFGLLFVLLFGAGVAWTYRSWKREDAERMDKELEKVREQLRLEAQRLVTEVVREKSTRIAEHLDRLGKESVRRAEDLGRQIAQRRQGEQTRERQAARERVRIADQRLRDMDGLRTQVQRMSQSASEVRRDSVAALRSLA